MSLYCIARALCCYFVFEFRCSKNWHNTKIEILHRGEVECVCAYFYKQNIIYLCLIPLEYTCTPPFTRYSNSFRQFQSPFGFHFILAFQSRAYDLYISHFDFDSNRFFAHIHIHIQMQRATAFASIEKEKKTFGFRKFFSRFSY